MRVARRVYALLYAILCAPLAVASETATVTRVVDGDTLVVDIAGQEERVRLIGVDTPETVHPNKPVEFFGNELETSLTPRTNYPNIGTIAFSTMSVAK